MRPRPSGPPRAWLAVALALVAAACHGDNPTAPGPGAERGDVISATLLEHVPKAAVAALLAGIPASTFQARYDVDVYAVRYQTVDVDGRGTVAGGAVVLPTGAPAVPLMSYSHGTVTQKGDVPSNPQNVELLGAGILNGSHGDVVALEDYLGLGSSTLGYHPYLHAASEASAALDALRAARTLAAQKGAALNGQLFVFGYSQGGQAAMALVREIEQHAADEFTVTAAAPMSGPYDLLGTVREVLQDTAPNPDRALYSAYVLAAYNRVYQLAGSLDQLLRPPYDAVGAQLASASISEDEAKQRLAPVPRDNVQPAVVTALLTDPQSAIPRALAENDVYDWKPRAPMRLYYASGDQTVPPRNTLTAAARMQELGANVEVVDLGPIGHTDAALPAFVAARSSFDCFVK